MILNTNAIVLNRMKYKNSSLIARIFTENSGKISIIMNGAGKRKGNIVGIIEPPNIIKLDYYQRQTKSLQTCKEVSFLYNNTSIRNDITTLGTSLAIVEIIDKTFHENDPNADVYYLAINALQLINNKLYDAKLVLTCFMFELINELGFMMDLENESDTSIIISESAKEFLLQLNQASLNNLDQVNSANIKLIDIITNLEIYIKQHLKLNKDIESLKMIREVTYG